MDWLWLVQVVGALLFLAFAYFHGIDFERLRVRPGTAWLNALGRGGTAVVSVLELLGALGLILPMATGTLPWLTPVAAICLVLLMLVAMVFHAFRREWPNIGLNLFLAIFPAIVAYGRWDLLAARP